MSWAGLLRWEWFKLRGRRVIWAMLGALLVFAALVVFIRFGDYQFVKDQDVQDELIFKPGAPEVAGLEVDLNCTRFLASGEIPDELPPQYTVDDVDFERTGVECRKEVAAIESRLDKLEAAIVLPTAVGTALRWVALLMVPFVALLTVMVVGSEYGWGTLRTLLMRGPGRWRVLLSKLVLVALAMVIAWLAVLLVIVVSSLVATALTSGVGHGEIDGSALSDILRDVGRAWYASLPYVALAALLSILFSTWSGGMLAAAALSTAYFFIEVFSVGRIIQLFEDAAGFSWVAQMAEFDLGWNTAAWMFGRDGEPIPGFQLASAIGTTPYPSDEHAFGVQLVFLGGLLAVAFWLFGRKDVAGPTG
jgi:ABC-type transport system involved in multi-copper enzyme maturation permease subunit